MVPDLRHGRQGHSYVMNDVLPQRRYPEIFVLISQWEVCQEGGLGREYLEDVDGS